MHRNEEVRLYRMGSIINRSPNNQDEGRFSISKLDQLIGRQQDEEFPLFSFHSIETATNFFSPANKIGEGGFGTIYKVSWLISLTKYILMLILLRNFRTLIILYY